MELSLLKNTGLLRSWAKVGEVYLAEDTSLKRKVALKFLTELLQQDPMAQKRFLKEARSTAALDHPYICHVHEVGNFAGKYYIAMEYIEGLTLRDKLREGALPLKSAFKIAAEVAEALEIAHKRGIVHRDLKPDNIMLTEQGHAKVMDFGIAKQVSSDKFVESQEKTLTESLTSPGMIVGTLTYMSPEQLLGKPVDTCSDIFSFGLILYEMLTGVHPFAKFEPLNTVSSILHENTPSLSQYLNKYPEQLDNIIRKTLEKDLSQRDFSAGKLILIFNQLSEGLGLKLKPVRGKPKKLRLRLGIIAGSALFSLLLGLVGWFFWPFFTGPAVKPKQFEKSVAVLFFEDLSPDGPAKL
ncbi:MAG TPA: serine/threonine protein kinase, partial [bacterium]|nr:serine/threonine protein kinase [bacterium]